MKVLWITNTTFPEAQNLLTGQNAKYDSGGWMLSSASSLVEGKEVELFVASLNPLVKNLTTLKGNKITYLIVPLGKGNSAYNQEYETYWRQIKETIEPDVVHIHGTEFTHGLSYVRACGADNVVVSIQGMKSVIARYYTAGIPLAEIMRSLTIHDILKGGIYAEQRRFQKSGKYEKELLTNVHHVIGRTSWDYAHTVAINPSLQYHFCNESLRAPFYEDGVWSYDRCTKHSIFLSQAGYPLKGLHFVLRALPLLIEKFPDITVRVAGEDITSFKGLSGLKHQTTYWRYLASLIKRYNLCDKVIFTGRLTSQQMKAEYLHANLFISPSSIENSPNSLGEAQILGTPCVASYVGGTPDFMRGNEDNMYRYDDVELLASKIARVFEAKDSITSPCSAQAQLRHNREANALQLVSIYKKIVYGTN